ncbi:alkaline phosphatase [Sphingobacterium hungaricum]|uniref:Alkaline phosphatase n=1 Tax=Sphingobacterium hungaricum TaxID=2082723 RepID=A0A928UTK8_9SPHI|nr:alkaline phosphatase [Sphingobacterium hungaricum]MBE8712492.1 alkaline phosphatase [Sphingobacterium hungaricum]
MLSRKIYGLILLFILQIGVSLAQKPKYIFFMIGDGMGLNQVNAPEVYLASKQGKNTVFPLVFSTFPYATFATSYSLSHGVTDSAAGGTALAVGKKTKNGVIAMDSSRTESYKSVAYLAKENGLKVGITTSVSIDHATPASFYAKQADRDMYYEIGKDLISSNFDFFAGAGFLRPNTTFKKEEAPSLFPQFEQAGYTLVNGISEYQSEKVKSDKIILMNNKGADNGALKYAIDQVEGDLTLSQITSAAIESLTKNNKDGFFLMVEGGKIDWACHSNDGATAIQEVLDFNSSVEIAYEFYKKYPEETLIIVTADHETGGIAVGNGSSTLRLKNLENQKISQSALSTVISDFRKNNPKASWDDVKALLTANVGLFGAVNVSKEDEAELNKAYEKSFVNHEQETSKSLYANDDKIASLSVKILNKASSISWASGGHSAAYIPVFAIGAGSELFNHKMENTDIPKYVAEAAGWSW